MLKHAFLAGINDASIKLALNSRMAADIAKMLGLGVVPGAIGGAITGGEDHRLSGAGLGALGGALGAIPGFAAGGAAGAGINKLRKPFYAPGGDLQNHMRARNDVQTGAKAGLPLGSLAGGALMGRIVHEDAPEEDLMALLKEKLGG